MDKKQFANKEIEREGSASKGDELVIDIRAALKSLGPPLSHECCIYRVPNNLRRVNEAAYTPQMVSIGPLHHDNETLKRMDTDKLRCLDQFLERAAKSATLENFVSTIKGLEPRIRSCYTETFDNLDTNKFVKMILLDAAFILKHFLWCSSPNQNDLINFVFYDLRQHSDIRRDLMLLENQLPFFVLEELYNLAFPSGINSIPSFHELIHRSFSYHNKQKKSIKSIKHFTDLLRSFEVPQTESDIEKDKSNQQKVKHFIDWLRSFLRTHCCRRKIGDQAKKGSNHGMDNLSSATELSDAGVKFEVSSSKCLLDIEFNNGVLKIPCLKLNDDAECYIRNLMALEQCHYPHRTYICDYVIVMDYLINTARDVDLLVKKKIIVNMLGDRVPVATLFNNLSTHINVSEDNRYTSACKDLNAYCEVPSHKWEAILRHDYFGTPWRIASTTAAIILLVLTLIQTICAILSL